MHTRSHHCPSLWKLYADIILYQHHSVEMGEGWMQSALVHVLVLLFIREGICWGSQEGNIFLVCQCPYNEHRVGY